MIKVKNKSNQKKTRLKENKWIKKKCGKTAHTTSSGQRTKSKPDRQSVSMVTQSRYCTLREAVQTAYVYVLWWCIYEWGSVIPGPRSEERASASSGPATVRVPGGDAVPAETQTFTYSLNLKEPEN